MVPPDQLPFPFSLTDLVDFTTLQSTGFSCPKQAFSVTLSRKFTFEKVFVLLHCSVRYQLHVDVSAQSLRCIVTGGRKIFQEDHKLEPSGMLV